MRGRTLLTKKWRWWVIHIKNERRGNVPHPLPMKWAVDPEAWQTGSPLGRDRVLAAASVGRSA